eukprot:864669_1
MGNKSSKNAANFQSAPKLKPLEQSLTEIISRGIKENDIRFKDLDRFSHRISIFDCQIQKYGETLANQIPIDAEKKEHMNINDNSDEEEWNRVKK